MGRLAGAMGVSKPTARVRKPRPMHGAMMGLSVMDKDPTTKIKLAHAARPDDVGRKRKIRTDRIRVGYKGQFIHKA